MRAVSTVRPIGAFLRAPPSRKRLVLESAWELIRARLVTLATAQTYTAELGNLSGADAPMVQAAQEQVAANVGLMVARVAGSLPIRAHCLQQAIAVRRMLVRRGIPTLVCLGVACDRADRSRAAEGRAAHAWVIVGSQVISGSDGLENYAVVARFA